MKGGHAGRTKESCRLPALLPMTSISVHQSRQKQVHKIKHVLPIHAEHAAGAGAVAVDAEGGDASNDVAVAEEVWPARITKAGAASVRIIGQQQGEIAGEAGDVDLV